MALLSKTQTWLLVKLGEEAAELAQAAIRLAQKPDDPARIEELCNELDDVAAAKALTTHFAGYTPDFTRQVNQQQRWLKDAEN